MDILKQLYQDIRKQQRMKKKPVSLTLKGSSKQRKIKTIYSVPENWVPGPIVEILHSEGGGAASSLGFFRCLSHRMNSSAKRYVPTRERPEDANACAKLNVSGSHWLEQARHPETPRPTSLQETLAIRKRFMELIDG